MALSDRERNEILQTAIVRAESGERGAPASFTPEERECYLEYERDILRDLANGISPNYAISCSNDDW